MGTYKIEIENVGGHGCKREPKEGERVYGCRRMDCPDCAAADFVERLCRGGAGSAGYLKATFTHWPGEESQVVDRITVNERGFVEVTREKNDFFNSRPNVPFVSDAKWTPRDGAVASELVGTNVLHAFLVEKMEGGTFRVQWQVTLPDGSLVVLADGPTRATRAEANADQVKLATERQKAGIASAAPPQR